MWGDSLTSGYYDTTFVPTGAIRHASYCGYDVYTRSVDIENVSNSVPYKLGQLLGVSNYQNLGVNAQRTAQIDDRMPTDLTNLLPDLIIINAGRNDLSGGVGEATFLANYTTMLDSAKAQSNNVLVLSIYPATSDSDSEANTRRTWNTSLESLVNGYTDNFHFLNVDEVLGVIRVSTGEYDDINPLYLGGVSDGIHLNEDGNQALAQAIATYITSNNLLTI
jgi:lysophospholipase L1-like esterase